MKNLKIIKNYNNNRYLNLSLKLKMYKFIIENLSNDETIFICTTYKTTKCTKKHIELFSVDNSGVYIQNGKNKVCIDYTKICTNKKMFKNYL